MKNKVMGFWGLSLLAAIYVQPGFGDSEVFTMKTGDTRTLSDLDGYNSITCVPRNRCLCVPNEDKGGFKLILQGQFAEHVLWAKYKTYGECTTAMEDSQCRE